MDPTGVQVDVKSGPTETQHGSIASNEAKKRVKTPVKTGILRISDSAGYVPNFGRSCSQMGPCWVHLGAKWLEPSGSKLCRSWPQVGPMLRPCRIETVHLDDVGPICKTCALPKSRALFGALPGRACPAEFVTSTTKRHLRCVRIFYNLELHCSSEPDPLARNFTGWLWILICRNLRTLLFPTNFLDGTSSKTPPLLGHQLFQEASNLFDVFGRQLEGIGKMLMCLDKMKEGNYTTRIWCIFEARICVVIRKTSQRRFCGFTWYRCGTCFGLKPSNFKKALDMILAYAHVTLGFCDGATLPYCPHENAVMMAPGNRCSPCFLINRLLFPYNYNFYAISYPHTPTSFSDCTWSGTLR